MAAEHAEKRAADPTWQPPQDSDFKIPEKLLYPYEVRFTQCSDDLPVPLREVKGDKIGQLVTFSGTVLGRTACTFSGTVSGNWSPSAVPSTARRAYMSEQDCCREPRRGAHSDLATHRESHSLPGVVSKVTAVHPKMDIATYVCEQCKNMVFQPVGGDEFTPIMECPSLQCKEHKTNGICCPASSSASLPI